jgi:hypothetical protein
MPHSAVATHCTKYDILGQRIGQDAGKKCWDCRKMEHKAAAFHLHLNDCKTYKKDVEKWGSLLSNICVNQERICW